MIVKPFDFDLVTELVRKTEELKLEFSQNIDFKEFQVLIEKEIRQMQKTLDSSEEVKESLVKCLLILGKINAQKSSPKGFYEGAQKINEIIEQRKKLLKDSIFISSAKEDSKSQIDQNSKEKEKEIKEISGASISSQLVEKPDIGRSNSKRIKRKRST